MNGSNAILSLSSDADDYIDISIHAHGDEKLTVEINDISHEDSGHAIGLTRKQAIMLRDFLLLAYPKE
jgi:predicted protein tyrosine phosphatase